MSVLDIELGILCPQFIADCHAFDRKETSHD